MDYAKSAIKAKAVLKRKGTTVKIRVYGGTAYNPATSEKEITYIDSFGYGAFFDFDAGKTNISGSLIEKGDKRLYLDSDTLVNIGDHIFFGTVEYEIIGVGEINPAGILVLYDLHLRL